MGSGRGNMERVRRATRTVIFMIVMVASLVSSSAAVIVAMADTIIPCILLSMFTCCSTCYSFKPQFIGYSVKSSLSDVPLLSLVRSVVILFNDGKGDMRYTLNKDGLLQNILWEIGISHNMSEHFGINRQSIGIQSRRLPLPKRTKRFTFFLIVGLSESFDAELQEDGQYGIFFCAYYICDVHCFSNGPYLATCLFCSLASAVVLSVKACLFNSSDTVWSSPPVVKSPRFKQSWGMPAMFLSSMVLALGHIVVAYKTQCQSRRRLLFQRIDPEAAFVSKAVLHAYQKVPRSPKLSKISKGDIDGKARLIYEEKDLPVKMLANDDSHFIQCEGLVIHYKISAEKKSFSLVCGNFEDAQNREHCISIGRTQFEPLSKIPSPIQNVSCHLDVEGKHDNLDLAAKFAVSARGKLMASEHKRSLDGIVLIHGFGGGAFSWRQLMPPLARHSACVVVAFDRPGWGLTSRPQRAEWEDNGRPNPYELRAQVDMLFSFCCKLGLRSVVLIGHDDGGLLALMAAEKAQNDKASFPVEVKGVILVSVSITREVVPAFARVLLHTSLGRHMLRPLLRTEIIQVANRRAWYNASKLTADVLDLYKAPLRVEGWDKALAEVSKLSIGSMLSSNDVSDLLKGLQRMPALIVSGAEDILVSVRSSQVLAAKLPSSRLVAISSCGHLPHEECPKALLAAIIPFVSKMSMDIDSDFATVRLNIP